MQWGDPQFDLLGRGCQLERQWGVVWWWWCDMLWYWDYSESLSPFPPIFGWINNHLTEGPHLVGARPLPASSIFLFPGLIFIQNFCQFIMVGNPPSSLPTTTCLWFQGLTVFVIDIKLKENTNPSPTDQQGHSVRISINTDQTYNTQLQVFTWHGQTEKQKNSNLSLGGGWLREIQSQIDLEGSRADVAGQTNDLRCITASQSLLVLSLSLSLSLSLARVRQMSAALHHDDLLISSLVLPCHHHHILQLNLL